VKFFPRRINIEPTNYCNLRCIHCPRQIMKREKGFMDFSLFKKIIDECKKYKNIKIWLQLLGEPLLHPKIIDMIKYAKENNIKEVGVVTNGILLNANLDYLCISVDAFSKKTYEKIRCGGNYEVLIGNIKKLFKVKEEFKKSKPIISLNFVKMEENIDEFEDFIKFWKPYLKGRDFIKAIEFDTWGGKIKDKGINKKNFGKRLPCSWLWYATVILWNGDLVLCCADFDGEMILGNVKKENIETIWNSDKYNDIRLKHLEWEFEKISICKNCQEWKYDYLRSRYENVIRK